MKSSPRAFTMIELILAILIIAILSLALLTNFTRSRLKANFDEQVTNIVRVIEEARSYSRTNVMVHDTEPTKYYVLTIGNDYITIDTFGDTDHETIEEYDFDDGFTSDAGDEEIYYFPPYGNICFSRTNPCTDTTTEFTFTLSDSSGTYTKDITLNVYGGYPEVSD